MIDLSKTSENIIKSLDMSHIIAKQIDKKSFQAVDAIVNLKEIKKLTINAEEISILEENMFSNLNFLEELTFDSFF